jgi:hypothetical protein
MNPAILSMKDFSATDSGLRVSPIGLLKRRCGDSLEDISDYKEETDCKTVSESLECLFYSHFKFIPENHLKFKIKASNGES